MMLVERERERNSQISLSVTRGWLISNDRKVKDRTEGRIYKGCLQCSSTPWQTMCYKNSCYKYNVASECR